MERVLRCAGAAGALLSLLAAGHLPGATAAATCSGVAKAKLKREAFEEVSRVPLGAEHRIGGTLPLALTGKAIAVREGFKRLEIDLKGNGLFRKKVTVKKPVVIELPGESREGVRSLLVYWRRGAWYASSASSLVGKILGQRVVLLDADLDGTFLGEGDHVWIGAGSPVRCDGRGLVAPEGALHRVELEISEHRIELRLEAVPRPEDATEEQWEALVAVNLFRTNTGLPPETLSTSRSSACQLHAEYLYLNDYDFSTPWDGVGSHEEVEGNPGYTADGREAAHNSVTGGTGDPAGRIAAMSRTMLHRVAFLGAAGEGIGVGAVSRCKNSSARGYSVIWTGAPRFPVDRPPVVVPAPGQSGVELRGKNERPAPVSPEMFYGRERGYPVSASFGRRQLSEVDLRLFVVEGRKEQPVEGFLFTPESPVHSTRPGNAQTAFFMPATPLEPGQRYVAVLSAKEAGEPVAFDWSFTTGQ